MESLKKPRISFDEQKFLGRVFKDREDLLILIRDLFFGFPLLSEEKATLKAVFASVELKRVLRKIFLPELERGLPIGESIDLWMTVQLSGDEKANKLNITVRQKLIEMFETALDLLDNIEGEVVNLHRVETTVPLLARVSFITNIEARHRCFYPM